MSWVTASKEGGYQCKAPSHPGRKKIIWACTKSLHHKRCKVSMRCDMPRGFVSRVNIFDVCVVLEDEHVLMTTQHNNRIILLLLRSLTKHLLSHCCVNQFPVLSSLICMIIRFRWKQVPIFWVMTWVKPVKDHAKWLLSKWTGMHIVQLRLWKWKCYKKKLKRCRPLHLYWVRS